MNYSKADLEKNRLYIHMEGTLTEQDAVVIVDQTIENARKLKPGFGVINDMADLKPGSPEVLAQFVRLQIFVKEHGVGRIVRIVTNAVTKSQFGRGGRMAGYEKDPDIAESLEQAEAILNSSDKK